MDTTLYLLRHAHSFYSPDELNRPLSEKGLNDAAIITELLKTERIDTIYSSPYKRAIQTAAGTAKHHGLEIQIEADIRERTLSPEPAADFQAAIRKVWKQPDFSWPGGESNLEAQARGVNAIHKLMRNHRGRSLLVSTHGNLMVLIMNAFDSRYDYRFWQELEMPALYRLVVAGEALRSVEKIAPEHLKK